MRKEIKKYGNSAVIVLTTEDLKLQGLKVGDVIELGEISGAKIISINKKEGVK